jgi:hypothetical protein
MLKINDEPDDVGKQRSQSNDMILVDLVVNMWAWLMIFKMDKKMEMRIEECDTHASLDPRKT